MAPQLLVTVDTEAEFDWSGPYSRSNRSVVSIASQTLAHEIYDRYGAVPTYLVDHAVASDDKAIGVLKELLDDGRCEIGAHLNPWINPPFCPEDEAGNSYAGRLPKAHERDKLKCLTSLIVDKFGVQPQSYRAGRYGIGPNTPAILKELGYQVDMSVLPCSSFEGDGGPDFSGHTFQPFWWDREQTLLELPTTAGFSGPLIKHGPSLYPLLTSPVGMTLHLPGMFSRAGLLERATLTPEGITVGELQRLTKSLLSQGCRIFCFTYHSPSLSSGNTPYVRNDRDLEVILARIEQYLELFTSDLAGNLTTPMQIFYELERIYKWLHSASSLSR